jgi:hypothetical protein
MYSKPDRLEACPTQKELVMSFTGKATYLAGSELPEIAEDVSDLVSIAAPHETPLLEALGDGRRAARSTVHEWLEDSLLPNQDAVSDASITNPTTETAFGVVNIERFRVGDQVSVEGKAEVMLVTATDAGGGTLTVTRGYGGSTAATLADGDVLRIIGNAALEGADADAARFTARRRQTNYTQIFASTVEVSGSELAVRQIGVADEMDYHYHSHLNPTRLLMLLLRVSNLLAKLLWLAYTVGELLWRHGPPNGGGLPH